MNATPRYVLTSDVDAKKAPGCLSSWRHLKKNILIVNVQTQFITIYTSDVIVIIIIIATHHHIDGSQIQFDCRVQSMEQSEPSNRSFVLFVEPSLG